MGNCYLCATSGVAHVCDQNCNQRIFYDNHNDICRLSKRLFPRDSSNSMGSASSGGGPEGMGSGAGMLIAR